MISNGAHHTRFSRVHYLRLKSMKKSTCTQFCDNDETSFFKTELKVYKGIYSGGHTEIQYGGRVTSS